MKKLISFSLTLIFILSVLNPVYANAKFETDNALESQNATEPKEEIEISQRELAKISELKNLEKQKENNLISIKEQLEEQNLMEHYDIYKKLVEAEYNGLKDQIEGESTYNTTNSNRYTFYYGGQTSFIMGAHHSDPRARAHLVSEYYTRSQTSSIINEFDRNNRVTIGDMGRFIVEYVVSRQITGIGPILVGIEGAQLLKGYITASQFEAIENSQTKSMIMSSSTTTVGKSTTIREWSDNPYAYIPTSATSVSVKYF